MIRVSIATLLIFLEFEVCRLSINYILMRSEQNMILFLDFNATTQRLLNFLFEISKSKIERSSVICRLQNIDGTPFRVARIIDRKYVNIRLMFYNYFKLWI